MICLSLIVFSLNTGAGTWEAAKIPQKSVLGPSPTGLGIGKTQKDSKLNYQRSQTKGATSTLSYGYYASL